MESFHLKAQSQMNKSKSDAKILSLFESNKESCVSKYHEFQKKLKQFDSQNVPRRLIRIIHEPQLVNGSPVSYQKNLVGSNAADRIMKRRIKLKTSMGKCGEVKNVQRSGENYSLVLDQHLDMFSQSNANSSVKMKQWASERSEGNSVTADGDEKEVVKTTSKSNLFQSLPDLSHYGQAERIQSSSALLRPGSNLPVSSLIM